jgi:cytochrome c-type biogenesis protein CcmH
MRSLALAALLAAFLALGPGVPLAAFEVDEVLPDPAQELRARELSTQLRCLVCQNESIAESNAPLAADLRRIVRERIAGGDSDDQVLDYMVARYGDWVLLKPPFKSTTYALWFGPTLLFLIAAGAVALYFRRGRRRAAAAPPLDEAERRRLDALVDQGPER